MAHRLRKSTDVAAELVRLLRDDLATAIAALDGGGTPAERVFAVRRRLKWVRTLLAVLKGGVDAEGIASVRRGAAAAARLLAAPRDADVVAASAHILAAQSDVPGAAGFDKIAEVLDKEASAAHGPRVPFAAARREIQLAAEAASFFDTGFDGARQFDAAMTKVYRRGRRAMRRAEPTRDTAALHRWRRQAKRLWHLLRIAGPVLPEPADEIVARLDRLVEVLGLDHDHAVLADRLALSAPDRVSLPRQLALIAAERSARANEAFALGAKLYAAKPTEFAARWSIRTGAKHS